MIPIYFAFVVCVCFFFFFFFFLIVMLQLHLGLPVHDYGLFFGTQEHVSSIKLIRNGKFLSYQNLQISEVQPVGQI